MRENSTSDAYSVATLGFGDRERRVFAGVLAISEYRSPAFRMYAPQRGVYPHVVIINADHEQSLLVWGKYQAAHAHLAKIGPIFLTRNAAAPPGKYVLRRPILATRLFALLEQVVAEVHGYRPPLAIAEGDPLFVLAPGDTQELPAIIVPPPKPVEEAVARGVTALVVDDSLPVRVQMRSALRDIAEHVDFAESGEAALELIEKRRYSIIFLDVILPGRDGYDVCKRIKKHPLQQGTPVVMLTGSSSPADRVKGKLAGCDTYLIKPVKQAVFEQVVAEFVRAPAAA